MTAWPLGKTNIDIVSTTLKSGTGLAETNPWFGILWGGNDVTFTVIDEAGDEETVTVIV